uniref:Reverse transcriptase domain-containing protein n=1 Tax=Leptobrachium leishanense TaxID=445787 RepID=A0A8C5WGE5_9ANUR
MAAVLRLHLTALFNAFMRGEAVPSLEMLNARIVVIPKEGKDHTLCANYRPISLINVDVKIFAKLLASRLGACLPALIHVDQVGFIPGREAPDNIRCTMDILQVATTGEQGAFLLSLDAEKAFDREAWPYMWEVLRRVGMGSHFLLGVRALYLAPVARVDTGGCTSDHFEIRNGTRQGCPLYLLLFALSIEPLTNYIRHQEDIRGVEVVGESYKINVRTYYTYRGQSTTFIWGGKRSRLPRSGTYLARAAGGLGAPHLTYYRAAQLAILSLVNLPVKQTRWVQLEGAMGDGCPMDMVMWLPCLHSETAHPSPAFRHSMTLWWKYRYRDGLSTPHTGLTPLFWNPEFPEGLRLRRFGWWRERGLTEVRHLTLVGKAATLAYLRESRDLSPGETFRASQLLHYVQSFQ